MATLSQLVFGDSTQEYYKVGNDLVFHAYFYVNHVPTDATGTPVAQLTCRTSGVVTLPAVTHVATGSYSVAVPASLGTGFFSLELVTVAPPLADAQLGFWVVGSA